MGSGATREDIEHLRHRVRLYLLVMLLIDLLALADDLISPLFFEGLKPPVVPAYAAVLRHGVTVVVTAGWAFTRFAKPGRLALIGLESGVSVGLALVYVTVARTHVTGAAAAYAPMLALFGLILLLTVRAALVPSPVWRTAAIGVVSMAALFGTAHDVVAAQDPVVTDGTIFVAVAAVFVTSITSRVIYGLRQEVRQLTQLGQYTLERKLGEGGMGVVYEAQHGMLRRPTAVKLLPPGKVGDAALTRFEREVRLTARLSHPNTVTIFDYGRTPEGVFYYAMELLRGATLSELVAIEGPQPAARVVALLADCAGALHEAHEVGLIHRDVKPANIMACRQGGRLDVAKLLDFGLVKQLDATGDPALTGGQVIVGTPHYMAPEAIGAPDAVDGRSDLYALGAVGYFLLTGEHLFEGTTALEICAHHLQSTPTSPSERLGRAVHGELEALVMCCLAKAPADRPASAAALERRLRALRGLGAWRADEWWAEYGPAVERLHAAPEVSATTRTIAVDLAGRT
jgi:eukaryotic-like serine/threonine-protein kinase